jgi:hypothetical protein
MQDKLIIKGTNDTPSVNFNATDGVLSLNGRSIPENAHEFYSHLLNWIEEYSKNPKSETVLNINLDYLNSGSLKQLFRLIYKLEDLMELGHQIKITWKYRKGDHLMMQKGHEFKQFLQVPIELDEL